MKRGDTILDPETVGFPFPIVTAAVKQITRPLRDEGALMRLWRLEPMSPRRVMTVHHVGFDLKPEEPLVASFEFERVFANPPELPA